LPSYKIHFSIAKANASLKNYDEAVQSYERFLEEGDKKVKSSLRDKVKEEIEMLRGLKKIMREKDGDKQVSDQTAAKADGGKVKKPDKKTAKKQAKKKKAPAKKQSTEEDSSLIP
jgi:hypothetical protein